MDRSHNPDVRDVRDHVARPLHRLFLPSRSLRRALKRGARAGTIARPTPAVRKGGPRFCFAKSRRSARRLIQRQKKNARTRAAFPGAVSERPRQLTSVCAIDTQRLTTTSATTFKLVPRGQEG